jgi:hypothetical protein
MKLLLITALISVVTFSKWECSITESKYRDGRVEYSAHYKGKEYVLTWDQYQDHLAGKDISIPIDTLKTSNNETKKPLK